MRLTGVVLTSLISSITSKICWIVGWPWSNHVCVCVWVCVCVCNWFCKLIHGPQKQILIFFVWKFGFWPGEVIEKSWNFFLRFLWEPCFKITATFPRDQRVNPSISYSSLQVQYAWCYRSPSSSWRAFTVMRTPTCGPSSSIMPRSWCCPSLAGHPRRSHIWHSYQNSPITKMNGYFLMHSGKLKGYATRGLWIY